MNTRLAIGIGAIGIGLLFGNAFAADTPKQDKGMVNERSTGNEPFTGPGASGGPMHSSPGATERTTQENTKAQSGMGDGGAKAGGAKGQSKKSGASGSGGGGH